MTPDELCAESAAGSPVNDSAWNGAFHSVIPFGRKHGLPEIPVHFMPEFRTVIDPITGNELRFAAHRFGEWEVAQGAVWRTREMIEDHVTPDYAAIDGGIRAAIWYGAQAIAVEEPSLEICEFIAAIAPHKIGSHYADAGRVGSWPADLDAIKSIDDLMKFAKLPIGPHSLEEGVFLPPSSSSIKLARHLVICGNGDESEAIAQLCRECALVVAGYRTAREGACWRIPPEIDIQTDIFGRKVVAFYARAAAYAGKEAA